MKAKKVFDGWELIPENRKDKQMIRELWNHMHPNLQIRRLNFKGGLFTPKIVLAMSEENGIRVIKVFVYSGG